jgi:hypothetical protein
VSKYFASCKVEKVKDGENNEDAGVIVEEEVHDTGTVPVVTMEGTDLENWLEL